MRNLPDVLQQIIAEIPVENTEFITELNAVRNDCLYTAPEMAYRNWEKTTICLQSYIPNSEMEMTPWQKTVILIWTDLIGKPN